MTFMPHPRVAACGATEGARAAAVLTKIPQYAAEQRHHPVFVQPGRIGGGQPAEQGTSEPRQLGQCDLAEGGLDERALARPSSREALGLQLAVGLEHGIRVDGQRGNHIPDLGQLVAGLEVAEPQRMLNLVDKLQVGRHARRRVQSELDRRPEAACRRDFATGIGSAASLVERRSGPFI
jgi:hypothetical protein